MLKRSQKVLEYELPVKIEPQKEGGYVVTSPVWKDCYAQGDTIDEAVLEVTAVAQSLIGLYKEEGLKIPLKVKVQKEKLLANHTTVPIIMAA